MTITVTNAQALAKLREIVSERPDHVYCAPEHMWSEESQLCFYAHTDKDGSAVSAGCGIGELLHRLGVPLEQLREVEGYTAMHVVNRFTHGLSRETVNRLRIFQAEQDQGRTWGESYVRATGEAI
ncbi:hypothetical protein [Streptomyces antibioticus]|uniref:hypothetical protein n=1 Tax=Streptomyces antibioticus TaxID=1890 RepID=UPI0033D2921E